MCFVCVMSKPSPLHKIYTPLFAIRTNKYATFRRNNIIDTYFINLFAGQRKSNAAYLDVPSANFNHLQVSDNDDEDVDRLRTFSSSKGGKLS